MLRLSSRLVLLATLQRVMGREFTRHDVYGGVLTDEAVACERRVQSDSVLVKSQEPLIESNQCRSLTRRELFHDVLRLSAEVHYLVAHVHPFEDGNGRIARATGDYAMLVHGFYYDVIMTNYRDHYLDALAECTLTDARPLVHFLEYSYLETLRRIATFIDLVDGEKRLA